MKLSVVIPAYNEETLIGQCLSSIQQAVSFAKLSPTEYEIIVADNASTDRTAEVASHFPNVRVVHEANKGASHARETGFRSAHGSIIAFHDADTSMPEQWLSLVLNAFEQDKHLAAITGPIHYFELPLLKRIAVRFFYLISQAIHLLNHRIFHIGGVIQGGNYAVKQSILEEVGGHDTSIAFYGDDTDIAKRIGKMGNIRWTWKLYTRSSARRFIAEGVFLTGLRYAINHFSVIYFGKPVTHKYQDIRS